MDIEIKGARHALRRGACMWLLSCAAAAGPALADGGAPRSAEQRFEQALRSYEDNRWRQAYAELSSLADQGHAEAARITVLMWLNGSRLYGHSFDAAPEQVDRWLHQAGCAAEAAAASGPVAVAGSVCPLPLRHRQAVGRR